MGYEIGDSLIAPFLYTFCTPRFSRPAAAPPCKSKMTVEDLAFSFSSPSHRTSSAPISMIF